MKRGQYKKLTPLQNNVYQKAQTEKVKEELSFPEVFCLRRAPIDTLEFLQNVDKIFQKPFVDVVYIDHSTIKELGLEAALLLISEFSRITLYSPQISLVGKFKGLDTHIKSILIGIGYFRYYPKLRSLVANEDISSYIKHVTGTGSDSKASGRLVEAFYRSGHLDLFQSKRLGTCLLECLDNVSHHAYKIHLPRRLKGRWWLVGYCNKTQGELTFAVVDHGMGIATSLKLRRFEIGSFMDQFFGTSDENLIVEAFTRSFSSTRKTNRGLGLPGLKRILDQVGNGEVFVRSGRSECILRPGEPPIGSRSSHTFGGTLLAWTLKHNS